MLSNVLEKYRDANLYNVITYVLISLISIRITIVFHTSLCYALIFELDFRPNKASLIFNAETSTRCYPPTPCFKNVSYLIRIPRDFIRNAMPRDLKIILKEKFISQACQFKAVCIKERAQSHEDLHQRR